LTAEQIIEGAAPLVADETLEEQRRAWGERPLVRRLYTSWYERIVRQLARIDGPTVELGSGIGTFKEHHPRTIATDLFESPWAEQVVDAQDLPYGSSSIANLVMVDVLHHLPDPVRFLDEAVRVLRPGGRVVMVEPYCSPVSTRLWKAFHHEPVDVHADPFAGQLAVGDDPWDSNTATPTIIFWRRLEDFRRRYPELEVVTRDRFAWLVYPLSGGFSGRQLVPPRLERAMTAADRVIPLAPLAGLRCLVAVEKRA
jgi:SAM-dependent methyltransferase